MSAVDAAKIWSLNYRVLLSVISCAEDEICSLGLESKELFLLAEIAEHPYPAELATTLNPRSTNAFTIPAPMPEAPPVTIATLPISSWTMRRVNRRRVG